MSTQQQQGSVLAHVAGVYVASAFANWKMQISQGPVLAASPATFNLATGSFTLQDGTEISIPFTVGAPITIGNGAAQETVNVTAFNGTGTGAAYGQATVSANTSNTHGSGEPIISGSAGLCEACALCASQGGGIVVIDGSWNGTSANLATARQLFPTVSIVNNGASGGSSVGSVSVTLTAAQLKALQTTAITLVPAPGTNAAVIPLGMTLQYKYITPAYTIASGDNAFQIEYHTQTTNLMSTLATNVVDQSASEMITVAPAVAGQILAQTVVANLALEVKLVGTSAALTTGNGTVTINLRYQTITLT